MITAKPVPSIALVVPPVKAGTAKIITPIRRMITPRFFNNSFMVVDILFIIYFSTTNKVIITRFKKYFGTKMLKPFNLAFIFVYKCKRYGTNTLFDLFVAFYGACFRGAYYHYSIDRSEERRVGKEC